MLRAYARNFSELAVALRDIEQLLAKVQAAGSEVITEHSLRLRAGNIDSVMEQIRSACTDLGLDIAIQKLDRIQKVKLHQGSSARELQALFYELRERINDDLRGKHFFYVPASDIGFYEKPVQFGEEVHSKFPTTITDVEEAGKCLALGRYTASVFHLMRVMEAGVKELGSKVGLRKVLLERPWGELARDIGTQVGKMPQKPARLMRKKEEYATVLAHLNAVRLAWRNTTMHPKLSYTSEEAHEIFGHVKAFMRDLAGIL